ncbi:MAG: leucine-rich repeat protein [Oscillospiraceae bacterium]
MKKVTAVLAFLCALGSIAMFPNVPTENIAPYSIVANAATVTAVEPGVNASQYSNPYLDDKVSTYSTPADIVKTGLSSKDEKVKTAAENLQAALKDYATKTGITLGMYKVNISQVNEEGKSVIVQTEYHAALVSVPDTQLDVVMSNFTRPAEMDAYAEALGVTIEGKGVTMIADGAFSKSYLKTIDLSGVVYIGKSAFSSASYITEITIPSTVRYVGDSVFDGSGLKTLDVQNEMVNIPAKFCSNTNLTNLTFAHPKLIRTIGASAFASTPVDETLFENWGAATGYEELTVGDSAYEGCESITKITIPDNIRGLGKSVFKGCIKATSLTFGKNTLYADQQCFSGCTALSDVKFNAVLEALGGGAFEKCTSLKTIKAMPNTMRDWVTISGNTGYGLGDGIFAGCTSLESVEFPKTPMVTKIPERTFSGCIALRDVYNHDYIVEIGDSAFSDCTSLLEAVYPKVNRIGVAAFKNCSSMVTFEVDYCKSYYNDKNVLTAGVGSNALEGCSSLTSITLLADAYGETANTNSEKTGNNGYVFKDCTAAKTIKIDGSWMEKMPNGIFSGCTALEAVDADVSRVNVVGKNAFNACSSLVKMPFSSVRIVEEGAFANCTSLESISTSGKAISAEDYGAKCFQNCSKLIIEVDGEISTIGISAFQNSGVTKVNLNGMTGGTVVIGASAFANCQNLASASISSANVKEFKVGNAVFSDCPILETVKFEGPILTQNMFKNCVELLEVQTNATTIQSNAFDGCTNLKKITDLATNTTLIANDIAASAFKNCAILEAAPANKDTVYSGTQQYAGCASIKSIETSVLTQGMFTDCTSLSDVKLVGVTDIPASCFTNCATLSSLDLSKMITIGAKAFMGTGLTSVTIENAQKVDTSAFQGCTALKEINVTSTSIGANAFDGCTFLEKATLYVDTVGKSAFNNCASLSEVNFQTGDSHTLTSIGASAFNNCGILYNLIVPGSPKLDSKAVGFNGAKLNSDFVLVGTPGSTVEEYAVKNKITFADIATFDPNSTVSNIRGDVDGNSVISVADLVKMNRWLHKVPTGGVYASNMDMNGDKVVNVIDLALLKQMLSKK